MSTGERSPTPPRVQPPRHASFYTLPWWHLRNPVLRLLLHLTHRLAERLMGLTRLNQLYRQALQSEGNASFPQRILNALDPEFQIKVGAVSDALGRGRHTTRHVELYHLACGADVVDSPGFSSFETDELNLELKHRLPETFREFAPYLDRCRFVGCSHTKEKGCAVLEAVRSGAIQKSRHASYLRLYEELKPLQDWQEKKK